MSKEKRRVPKLRFPGFTEDWEQRKLGTILSRRKENRLIDSEYPRLAFAAGQGVIPLSERRTNNRDQLISDEKNKKYLVTYYNDIVYNPANVKYGAIDRNKYGQGVISPIYVTFTSNVCSGFIEHIVKSNDFKQKALSFEEGTVTKRQAVNPDNLLNIDVDITLNIEEQKKISNLFELLGQYITLHQRKLDNLKLKKKALLQKLFPKNGERYPELRFPGFIDAWEQRKLGNIVDFLDGQRKPLKESERTKGKYPYYGASGIIDYINDYLFDENLVLLSEDGANIIDRNYPVCFIATGKYWVNNHAHVLKVKTGVIDKFICESLERLDYTKFNTGTAQPKLNQDICQKIVITIPNEDEQKCISEFLDRINNIITLHQRKLDHLQLQKKALLQQMFV